MLWQKPISHPLYTKIVAYLVSSIHRFWRRQESETAKNVCVCVKNCLINALTSMNQNYMAVWKSSTNQVISESNYIDLIINHRHWQHHSLACSFACELPNNQIILYLICEINVECESSNGTEKMEKEWK